MPVKAPLHIVYIVYNDIYELQKTEMEKQEIFLSSLHEISFWYEWQLRAVQEQTRYWMKVESYSTYVRISLKIIIGCYYCHRLWLNVWPVGTWVPPTWYMLIPYALLLGAVLLAAYWTDCCGNEAGRCGPHVHAVVCWLNVFWVTNDGFWVGIWLFICICCSCCCIWLTCNQEQNITARSEKRSQPLA